jgi:SAM-dependent methyltransferase
VADEVRFRAGLFRGCAGYYNRYRLPYPEAMITDLVRRAQVAEGGRLLDLACGTGQLTFPLRRWFREVWAVDQEPEMVGAVRAKAAAAAEVGAAEVLAVVASAEDLDAEPESFSLAVVGNAFHRLDRDLVAGRCLSWLRPGGGLALCWSSQPWIGEAAWQRALAAMLDRWRTALGAQDRIPAGWELARQRRPDLQVLSDAGFEAVADREFAVEHRWSLPELAGLIRSTSFLPAVVLGDEAGAFDDDLAASLGPHSDGGAFPETVTFVYELARKPGPWPVSLARKPGQDG